MTLRIPLRIVFALALLAAACAPPQKINLSEPRRVLGTESDVRLDAEIRTDTLNVSQQVPIDYVITNNRTTAIAVADILPNATYDAESRLVTVEIGTEVPGEEVLPRLQLIPAGEKRSFTATARVMIAANAVAGNPGHPIPTALQLKLSFLGDPAPFQELVGIPERAVRDPKLAATLFPKWLEKNETLYTNSLPMRWGGRQGEMDPNDIANSVRGKHSRKPD